MNTLDSTRPFLPANGLGNPKLQIIFADFMKKVHALAARNDRSPIPRSPSCPSNFVVRKFSVIARTFNITHVSPIRFVDCRLHRL